MNIPKTESAKSTSTRVHIDENWDTPRNSLLSFLDDAIATTGILPIHTEYGQQIEDAWEFSGEPYISNEVHILPSGAKQPTFNPAFIRELGRKVLDHDSPDTVKVQPGNVANLMAELAHAKQFLQTERIREALWRRAKEEKEFDMREKPAINRYHRPGTVEHTAHEILEPALKKKFDL